MTRTERDAAGDFVWLCDVADVAEGQLLKVSVGNEDLLICRDNGSIHVLEDTCTHALASLSEGYLEDGKIFCPLHGGAYEIATGKAASLPCKTPLKKFPVEIRHSGLWAYMPRSQK